MRKRFIILVAACALISVTAGLALAQPPVNGTFKTTNGDFLEGRSSTSWSSQTGRLMGGNVLNIESFDGATLGAQWRVYCMQVVNVFLVADLTFFGNGSKIYQITYAGGVFELDGSGPWGGGDPTYTGVVDSYTETRTIQYVAGNITGANSNHSVSGHLNGYTAGCIALAVGNGVLIGDTDPNLVPGTDTNVKPADYPAFLDPNCGATRVFGRWGNVGDITLTVSGCLVPAEEKTWGGVKKLYE